MKQALVELERGGLSANVAPRPARISLKALSASAAETAEKEVILRTLNEVNWNRRQAARRLDICYKSRLNKLRRWKLRSQTESVSDKDPDERTFEAMGRGA